MYYEKKSMSWTKFSKLISKNESIYRECNKLVLFINCYVNSKVTQSH